MQIDIFNPSNGRFHVFNIVFNICALILMLIQTGCNDGTVVVKPESGGLLPPANPSAPEVVAEMPLAIPAGQDHWLDTATLPITTWYSQYLNGKCIGFSQFTIAPSPTQGIAQLVLTKRDVLEVAASEGDLVKRREIVLESSEGPDGLFRRYSETSKIDDTVATTEAVLQEGTLTSTKTVNGISTATSVQWPSDAWGPLGTIAVLRQPPMQPDEYRTARMYVPPLSKIVNVEFRSKKWELATLPGGVVAELLPVETKFVTDEGTSLTKNWVDKTGQIVKSISQGGYTMFQTTRDEAERIDSEILAAQLIALKIPVRATEDQLLTKRLTYSLDVEKYDLSRALSSNVNQQVTSLSALGDEVTVHRATATDATPEGVTQDPPNDSHSTKFANDALELQRFLSQFPEDSSDVVAMVSKLTGGVFRKLKKLTLSRKFNSPTETLQQGAGDCKAHTALLVAALRERGIPARAASGLRIVKADNEIVAIYHMWCEAWIGERWLPLEPFAGSIGVGVDHIKFLESSLNDSNPNLAMLKVLQTMKQLTIAIKP